MANLVLTDQNFQTEVLESTTPVLVDFWAEWCHPCKLVGPIVDELAVEYDGKLKVGKVDVDANQVPGNYGIMSIPTLLIFQNGKVVKSMVGAQSKDSFKREIDSILGN
jgi:thioredoxin 1